MVSDKGEPRPILPFPFPLRSGTSCLKGGYSTIRYINLYPVDSAIGFPRRGIHQEIYPMESSIQLLNNWGLDESRIVSVH